MTALNLVFALDRIDSPLGGVLLAVDDQERLRVLDFETHLDRMHRLLRRQYRGAATVTNGRAPEHVVAALGAYFAGDLTALQKLEVESAGTAFQREVWNALRRIPPGKTLSYGALAADIGRPAAVRAVGLANGANPIGIVVPCHRVIGADTSLTGYAGGVERKRWLLRHEGALPSVDPPEVRRTRVRSAGARAS